MKNTQSIEEQPASAVRIGMATAKQTRKLGKLFEYFQSIREEKLTGYIKVNFNQGNICKVEKYEEILRK